MRVTSVPSTSHTLIRRITMARKPVVQIDCARCGCKEYLEQDSPEAKDTVDLTVTFLGETYQFDDLCSKCKATCKNYVDNLFKDVKGNKAKKKRGPSKKTDPTSETSLPPTSTASGTPAARARPTSSRDGASPDTKPT